MPSYLDLEARLGGTFIHPGGQALSLHLLRQIQALGPGRRLLEIGCGPGSTTALFAAAGVGPIIALERSSLMLAAARARLAAPSRNAGRVQLLAADAVHPLPLASASVDVIYAESVLALLDLAPALAECARVLRPGGMIFLNERIWKPGVSPAACTETNALSLALYGIPAATAPYDWRGWRHALLAAGFEKVQAQRVDDLLARIPAPSPTTRWPHAASYLRHPTRWARSLWFKLVTRRHRHHWQRLESYFFQARRSH